MVTSINSWNLLALWHIIYPFDKFLILNYPLKRWSVHDDLYIFKVIGNLVILPLDRDVHTDGPRVERGIWAEEAPKAHMDGSSWCFPSEVVKGTSAEERSRSHINIHLRLASISGHGLELSAVSLYDTLVNVLQLNHLRFPRQITRD